MADPTSGQAEGTRALRRADWEAARDAFRAAVAGSGAPEAREGLGLALWFLGDVAGGIAERERAFAGYVAEHRCSDAARTAVWVSHQHGLGGRASAARGWLARAERALEGTAGPTPGRGWVAVEHARRSGDVQVQLGHARTALDLAGRLGDGDLEVFALSLLGRATAASGRREAGLALMEEAMAAAAAGRVHDVHTLAEAYCTLIEGCVAVGDWERGSEWCALVEDFARAHRAAPLVGACQTMHADVLVALGDWPAAERALLSGMAAHAGHVPQMAGPTVAALAELRVLQGRLGEAGRLLLGREDEPASAARGGRAAAGGGPAGRGGGRARAQPARAGRPPRPRRARAGPARRGAPGPGRPCRRRGRRGTALRAGGRDRRPHGRRGR